MEIFLKNKEIERKQNCGKIPMNPRTCREKAYEPGGIAACLHSRVRTRMSAAHAGLSRHGHDCAPGSLSAGYRNFYVVWKPVHRKVVASGYLRIDRLSH